MTDLFLRVISPDLFVGGAQVKNDPLCILKDNAVRAVFDEGLPLFLVLSQCLLGFFSVRDIPEKNHAGRASLVLDAGRGGFHFQSRTVLFQNPYLDWGVGLPLKCILDTLEHPSPVIWMEKVERFL